MISFRILEYLSVETASLCREMQLFIQFLVLLLVQCACAFHSLRPVHNGRVSLRPSSSVTFANRVVRVGTRGCILYAGEGDQEWNVCTVVSNKQEAEGLRLIDLEVGEDLTSKYVNPGQYVKLKVGDAKPSFFAIASPPAPGNSLSFLIKESPNNDFILNAKAGDKLDMSAPMGNGFKIEEYFDEYQADFPTNSLLLFACGSGLAPIAAAIGSNKLGLKGATFRTLFTRKGVLYIGARTPSHLPFKSSYAAWEEMGLKVADKQISNRMVF